MSVLGVHVDFATDKDTLKGGAVLAGTCYVSVLAATDSEALLVAQQMVAARGLEPTDARLEM